MSFEREYDVNHDEGGLKPAESPRTRLLNTYTIFCHLLVHSLAAEMPSTLPLEKLLRVWEGLYTARRHSFYQRDYLLSGRERFYHRAFRRPDGVLALSFIQSNKNKGRQGIVSTQARE